VRRMYWRFIGIGVVAGWVATAGSALVVAQRGGRDPGALMQPGSSPGEIQRLFDAYVLLQAQQELQLSDGQYAKFVPPMKALLDMRRQTQAERMRLLADIRRLSRPGVARGGAGDADGELGERIRDLEALRLRAQAEAQRALQEIDAVLDVRQRARFRVFEEQMERRKMELLMRARRNRR
jgi:hypothetical protein